MGLPTSKFRVRIHKCAGILDRTSGLPRWLSVFRRTFIAAVCYSKLDLLGARPPPKNNAGLFDVALVPVFRRFGCITSGQLRLRVVCTAGFYLPLYCINTRWLCSSKCNCSRLSPVGSARLAPGIQLSGRGIHHEEVLGVTSFFLFEQTNFLVRLRLTSYPSRQFWHQFSMRVFTKPSFLITQTSSASPKDHSQCAT